MTMLVYVNNNRISASYEDNCVNFKNIMSGSRISF